jgi:hypothetical protein
MKKNRNILIVALMTIGFVSCTSNKGEKNPTVVLKEYVDSVNSAKLEYSPENWAAIDKEFQERASRAEAEKDKLNEEDKAALEESKQKYAELKAKYEAVLAKNAAPVDAKIRLRNSLFGEGKVGQDISFNFVTANNILNTYQSFVDAVAANKDNYSREDWDEIKVLYEALDTRKNEVERDLKASDNTKIASLKIKYASIYGTNRPGSKVSENADAKK